MSSGFRTVLEKSPVIAAVKDMEGLEKSLTSECNVLFILFGDICNIAEIVKKGKQGGRKVMVHVDLIAGLSPKEIAVDFIRKYTEADGIITTKPALIKRSRELGLESVLRFFALDSMAFENVRRQLSQVRPDFVEVLPGQMPKVIRRISRESNVPVIAGGLIAEKEDVLAALDGGAVAISTTNQNVWFM